MDMKERFLLVGLCGSLLPGCSRRFINVNYLSNGFSLDELKSAKVVLLASMIFSNLLMRDS